MYVHELMASEQRRQAADNAFIKECCVLGVCHLALMLSSRAPLNPREDFSSNDATLPQLLQEGLFSDIHMLALMYSGELCYWAWEIEGSELRTREKVAQTGVDRGPKEEERERKTNSKTSSKCSDRLDFKTVETCGGGPLPAAMPLFSSLISQLKGRDYFVQYRRDFSAVDIGQSLLKKYIKLAQGPLKSQNWNYARAVELVVQLKRGC
ncbi:UPF0600 protein C5orf51 [Geodia barretti]|nr:UPF0600 protein C5orf51 [Geodia barretti]